MFTNNDLLFLVLLIPLTIASLVVLGRIDKFPKNLVYNLPPLTDLSYH